MTTNRTAALVALVVAAAFVVVAGLTPVLDARYEDANAEALAEIEELDAEAQRLGEEWVRTGQDDDELADRSNEFFQRARAAEEALPPRTNPPLGPAPALGIALLAAAGAVALWPSGTRTASNSDGGADAATD